LKEVNSFVPVPRAEFGFIDDAPVALLFQPANMAEGAGSEDLQLALVVFLF
jgi:hypothetical protein